MVTLYKYTYTFYIVSANRVQSMHSVMSHAGGDLRVLDSIGVEQPCIENAVFVSRRTNARRY